MTARRFADAAPPPRRRPCGRTPSTVNTFALSTQVTSDGKPAACLLALRRSARRNENSLTRRSAGARDLHGVVSFVVGVLNPPAPARIEKPSVCSRISTKSMSRARSSASTAGNPGKPADRPHARIEAEDHAQFQLPHDLGAIGVADVRPAHRAEQALRANGRTLRVSRRKGKLPCARRIAPRRRKWCSATPDLRTPSERRRATPASALITSGPMPSPGSTATSSIWVVEFVFTLIY
jgi:hypothetical protein